MLPRMIHLLLTVALTLGAQAPDFKLPDQNNKPVALAFARGHKAVVVFYRGYW
jgi:peroxiredoxin